ncbi:hypothetical protein K435DRAFT_783253 [Dendrothele bispora CBS 962.96]|uniref:Uncharacterized protein n=1 Tax=Dendrothele bispora (strain CBS 962.96) TaxID=1314807 RepID=A0A4S8LAM9_DENBC|nr:hypothetical protein K435DRAFT_783253 [Dendrothele bispora CBS 962.96]
MKIPITRLKNTSFNSSYVRSLSTSFPFCSNATGSTLYVILNNQNGTEQKWSIGQGHEKSLQI